MVSVSFALVLAGCLSSVGAASVQASENPIRKIVTLLQEMQKEIEAEGVKEQAAYDKFMCYCDGSTDGMKNAAGEGTQKAAELSSKLEALKAEKAQLEQELNDHQQSRASAKQDSQKADNIRTNEHAEFEAQSADMSQNIAAMKGAVAALEKGTAFVQMGSTQFAGVQRAVSMATQLDDFEKQGVLDFLQGKQSMQSSGQIIGMLKAMQEEMEGDLKSAQDDEAAAAQAFDELSAAKSSEIASATAAIEAKTKRSGEVAVEVVQTADDLEDTEADVAESQKFLADLDQQCASKKAGWSSRTQARADEVAAVGEAINILNDDDALDLFKKTASLTQTSLGFLQRSSKSSALLRAKHIFVSLAQTSRSHQTQLSLLASVMRSKAVDFSKITEQIDGMVDVLGKEQTDDDSQKAFCDDEFTKSSQEKKDTEGNLARLATSIEEMSATVESLASEIATLQAEIKALDKTVAEATEQRKADHADYLAAQAENQAATEILGKAKNRLLKFYRPGQHKEEPAEEAAVFAQVRIASNSGAVPPPPPETFGAYQKKDGKSNSVIGLMDTMAGELKDDHSDAEHAEDTAQREYENLMSASQKTRASNAKSITEKETAKAEWSEKAENAKTEQASTKDALAKLEEYISGLHASCDFLVENYGARKEARTNEVEGLKNAKAVLAGASFE